jgi:hypothetical protein
MTKLVVFIIVVFGVLHETHTQISKMNVCPKDIKAKEGFKTDDIKGKW